MNDPSADFFMNDSSAEGLRGEAAALEGEHIAAADAAAGQKTDAPPQSTADTLKPFFRIGFDVLAPNWMVSDIECGALADAYGPLIDKYVGVLDLGVELTALVITIMVFGPRMKVPRKNPPPAPADDAPAG